MMRRLLSRIGRIRLRVRTALALVAVVALLSVAAFRWVPDALWRRRIERAIAGKIEPGPPLDHLEFGDPSFQLFHGLSDDELRDLRRDPSFLVDRLLRIIGEPGGGERGKNALRALTLYLDEVEGFELPRRFVRRGVEMIASGTLPLDVETELAWAIIQPSRSGFMDAGDRAKFRERVRVILHSPPPHPDRARLWAYTLAQIGGREETEVILGAWDRLDRNGRSKLLEVLGGPDRPDMLPHLRRWLDDPELAPDVLGQTLPRHGAAGRDLLLGYALDPSRPADLRRRAVDVLSATGPGLRLLLRTVDDPSRRGRLAELPGLGPDPRPRFADELDRARYVRARDFYQFASTLTSPEPWGGSTAPTMEGLREAASQAEATARLLRSLIGPDAMQATIEWQAWGRGLGGRHGLPGDHDPPPLPLRRLLEGFLEHPALLRNPGLNSFALTWGEDEVPADLFPLYQRLARLGPYEFRYQVASAMLERWGCPEAVPILIDLIAESKAERAHSAHRRRYDIRPTLDLSRWSGVTFQGDVDAWRRWWSGYRPPSRADAEADLMACRPVPKGEVLP